MTPDRPQITVVIPVWGSYVERFLSRAVDSVLAQTGVSVTVLVVDNGNPPGTRFPDGVELVRSDTQLSLGASRNVAFAHITSPYVLFLDADDELCPGALRALGDTFTTQPDSVAVVGRLVDRRSGDPYHWPRSAVYRLARHRRIFAAAECCRPCFPLQATLMRTETLRCTPGYTVSDTAAEDWPMGVSLVLRGKVTLVDVPAVVYSPGEDGLWSRVNDAGGEQRTQRVVRERLRDDPARPGWTVVFLPLVALAHRLDHVRKTLRARRAGTTARRGAVGAQPDDT